MEQILALRDALGNLIVALWTVLTTSVDLLVPWLPLAAWIAFWLCAVNWRKLTPMLLEQGGIIGVLLLALMAILVWGTVAPPDGGQHFIAGLSVSNFVGKTVYVTALTVIAFLCGSVQVSGCCNLTAKIEEVEATLAANAAADHDDHGHHGHHDSHGDHHVLASQAHH